ncbi:hypothetical protein KSP39_PZI009672 [Platanthera zijinensis]|uniref:Uncharacterized protein n=1 Tax=Platanthera zijinensis TaxID=2320716 RepID=A0AAP0BLC3_9ASPA
MLSFLESSRDVKDERERMVGVLSKQVWMWREESQQATAFQARMERRLAEDLVPEEEELNNLEEDRHEESLPRIEKGKETNPEPEKDYTDWKLLKTKEKMWSYAQKKWIIPDEGKKWVFATINGSWRRYKTIIKQKFYNPYENDKERLLNRPKGIPEEQFKGNIEMVRSKQYKKLAKRKKRCRKKQKNMHTTAENAIIKAAKSSDLPGTDSPVNQMTSSELRDYWRGLSSKYTEEYEQCIENLLPTEVASAFVLDDIYERLQQLSDFEKKANSRVIQSGVLKGMNVDDIKCVGKLLKLHDDCSDFF